MGVSICDVAKYYGMKNPTVSNILKRMSAPVLPSNTKPRRGRPLKLNFFAIARLEILILENRFMPIRRLCALFYQQGTVQIGVTQLRKYIKNLKFASRVAVTKPFLRHANILKRMV